TRKAAGLPALKLNIILPKIVRILGAEREARAAVKAVPLRGARTDVAIALTKIFEKIKNDSDGLREIKNAWLDSIITDLGGWLEVTWTNDNNPLGQPIYRYVPTFFVVWDPSRQRYDLSKDRAILKSWFVTQQFVESKFKDKIPQIREVFGKNPVRTLTHSANVAWEAITRKKAGLDTDFEYHKENLIRLIDAQVREEVREVGLFDPDRMEWTRVDSTEELKVRKAMMGDRVVQVTRRWDKIRKVTTLGGDRLLLRNEDADVQNGMFSLIPFWGYRFGGKPMGIVKSLEGAQEMFWKEMSSAIHILDNAANPIWLIAQGSLTEKQSEALKKYGSRTGYILTYDPQVGPAPKREAPNILPSGQLTMARQALDVIDITSGVGQNAVGRKDTQAESGVLVEKRIGETLANLETLFDNKEKSVVLLHIYLIALIQKKMTAFRIERIAHDEEPLVLNLETAHGIINDISQGDYGVAIEKMSAKFHREEKFLKILLFARQTQILNPTILKLAIESFDSLEDHEKQELIKSIAEDNLEQKAQEMLNDATKQEDNKRRLQNQERKLALRDQAMANKRSLQPIS
ncbi:MAG: hypothetical protein ACE5HI_01040, partial [bacterium]